jgi:hypothetical protein
MAPGIVPGFALDRHRVLREYRRSVKERPMVLATIEAVTKTDPVRLPHRHKPDIAAQASTRKSLHVCPPLQGFESSHSTTVEANKAFTAKTCEKRQ